MEDMKNIEEYREETREKFGKAWQIQKWDTSGDNWLGGVGHLFFFFFFFFFSVQKQKGKKKKKKKEKKKKTEGKREVLLTDYAYLD